VLDEPQHNQEGDSKMSIRKNQNRKRKPWECRWSEEGKHYSRSFHTRKEAEQYDAERKSALHGASGFRTKDEKITLDNYAEMFLSQKKKPSTVLRNTDIYKRHIQPKLGAIPIRQIRHSDVQKIVDTWVEKGLQPRTITRQLAVLSAIFTMAERDSVINRIPTKGISRPNAEEPHRYVMTVEEFLKLRACIHSNYEAFMYTLVETGMRIGEAINLNIADFDWKSRTLKVSDAKTKAGNRLVLLSPTAQLMISAHIQSTGRTMVNQTEPLFVSHKTDSETGLVVGARINYSNFRSRIFNVARIEVGLPDLQLHDLRRTAATLLVDIKSSPLATKAQLGHGDIRTTLNLYAQVTPEAREESVSRMEDVLNPEPNRDEKEA
jgi:integrase